MKTHFLGTIALDHLRTFDFCLSNLNFNTVIETGNKSTKMHCFNYYCTPIKSGFNLQQTKCNNLSLLNT